ncbi:hypothetical protein H4R18_005184 [Coemansia javaensis]|uniref:Uncharacterized protein n=1 Tax=Coemansia javaensis TaxID=2761396 RepID=A0A9W8LDR3_9FUNG|nr:hypothetical protein H4R18_005184 [Coemansia javaensis]
MFGSAFGASSGAKPAAFGASAFGSSGTPAFGTAPAFGSSTFGSTTTAAPAFGGSGFGAAGSTAAAAAAASQGAGLAGITGKTRFVDLPEAVQKMLCEIERHKQVQVQIGSSIMADETGREVQSVGRQVQRLGQELAVVRMTLAGDRALVEDARQQVNFAVKHAEKGASLVAHATDDGSWAQSGLTPLQVANRQKALLALQGGGGGGSGDQAAAALLGGDQAGDGGGGGGGLAVDPFEAVRRIQVASMHHDAPSDYCWAWLTRAEAAAQLLGDRLDQLERHVAGAAAAQQQQQQQQQPPLDHHSARPPPRAVADVIQHQNDSLIAIAGRVAALDDDVRRLARRLGIKSSASAAPWA